MSTKPISEQLKEARDARAQAVAGFTKLSAKLGTPEWVEDTDGQTFESEQRNIAALDKTVERLQAAMEIQMRSGSAAGSDGNDSGAGAGSDSPISVAVIEKRGDNKEDVRKEFRLLKAIAAVAANRVPDGLEGEMHQEAMLEARTATDRSLTGNLHLPSLLIAPAAADFDGVERRDITAGTDATGGYTIETKLGRLIEFLYPRLAVLNMGATYFGNQTSNLSFPRNSSAAAAVWASTENASSTETTPNFELLSLTPKRLTAFTDVSKQNIVQSNIAMENFIRKALNMAVMQALDIAAINGAGSSGVPEGILNVSGVGDISLGTDGGLLTWDDIVNFETKCALENADMGTLGYLTTPGVSGYLKTVKRDVAGNGFIWEGPNRNALVNGYKSMVTNNMPSNLTKGSGTNLNAMIFGNWADLLIAQWGGIDLLVNPYTKGKEALIELIIHSWYDLGTVHNKSFTICDEIALS